jgi:hypothetical protein
MTEAARVAGAIFETEPGGGATAWALGTGEIESGMSSIGRTGLYWCFFAPNELDASAIAQK